MHVKQAFLLLSFGPRLVKLGTLAMLGLSLPGCVAARHYDEARSVAEAETTAHGRTRARLEAAAERIRTLEAELEREQQALSARESDVAQSKLDTTVAQKEREAAAMLVEQLRSELARTGDHLSSFSREKRDLQLTLLIAEQRMQGIENAGKSMGELIGTTRDLALALAPLLEKNLVELAAKDGQIVVGTSADRLFTPNGDALLMESAPLLEAVGKVSRLHPKLRVIVREPAGAQFAAARARHLGDALKERGVAELCLSLPSVSPEASAVTPGAVAESAPAAEETEEKTAEKPIKSGGAAPAAAAGSLRYEIAFAT